MLTIANTADGIFECCSRKISNITKGNESPLAVTLPDRKASLSRETRSDSCLFLTDLTVFYSKP